MALPERRNPSEPLFGLEAAGRVLIEVVQDLDLLLESVEAGRLAVFQMMKSRSKLAQPLRGAGLTWSWIMMSKMLALALLAAGLSAAQAQPYIAGNDTGGMIPWTPENQRYAVAASQDHCAYYGKVAYLTSVFRQYGNYIGFACAFPRGYIVRERRVVIRAKG
jgi:hypothetical protein